MTDGRSRRGCLKIALIVAALLALAFGGLLIGLNEPRPEAEPSQQADQLARRLADAGNVAAWERTGAVRWDFDGRQQHLWDRQRQLARVRWDDLEVLLDLSDQSGIVRRGGEVLAAEAAAPHLQQAWRHWCNDSFWLNPLAKLFDEGTRRSLVDLEDGGQGLLVEYTEGGVTPGDAYLWIVDDAAVPTAWRMWTRILPLQGIEASWDGWITLDTGARVATRHRIFFFELQLRDVAADDDVIALEGSDPFAELAE